MGTTLGPTAPLGGTGLAALAFGLWGLLPLYWRTLGDVGTVTILVQRLFWAALFSLGLLAIRGDLGALVALGRRRRERRILGTAAALMAVNWGLYTWAMVEDRLVEASLGYFLNPLVLAVLGAVFRKERPEPAHHLALGLATVGLVTAAAASGAVPWLALGLAGSFSLYALCKSQIEVDPVVGLAFETSACLPVAVLAAGLGGALGTVLAPPGTGGWSLEPWLALSGPATAVPLMLFSAATRTTSFLRLGFVEYLSPVLTLVVGLATGSPVPPGEILALGLIVLSCAVFVAGEVGATRREREALPRG